MNKEKSMNLIKYKLGVIKDCEVRSCQRIARLEEELIFEKEYLRRCITRLRQIIHEKDNLKERKNTPPTIYGFKESL